MVKSERQRLICKLIRKHAVDTQAELAQLLIERGVNVTQTTVSRDIKELKLIKILHEDGVNYKYALSDNKQLGVASALSDIPFSTILSVRIAANLVVVKTVRVAATVMAEAVEALGIPEVVGVVAGYDTFFVATESAEAAERVRIIIEQTMSQE